MSTGFLNASELANLEAPCACYAEGLDFLFICEDFLANTEGIMNTLIDPMIEVCSTRLSLPSNDWRSVEFDVDSTIRLPARFLVLLRLGDI